MAEDQTAVIQVKDVDVNFNKNLLPELAGVSFRIHRGEIVSLLGPSGCGKSTLLRLIAGVLQPTAGEITVFGQKAVPGWPGLGFVPQDSLLLPWRNVLENIRLPLELDSRGNVAEINRKACAVLELTNLNGAEKKYPRHLSGGMKQRVALARALVRDAQVLLLDEPFGALDDLTRNQLHLELLRLQERTGTTILLVTHNVFEAVFLSHRVMVMGEKPGRIMGEVPIALGWPRDAKIIGNPQFARLAGEIRELLESGWGGEDD